MHVNWMKQVVCIVVLVIQVFLALKTNIITIVFQISCLMVLVLLQYTSIKKVFRRLLTSVKR